MAKCPAGQPLRRLAGGVGVFRCQIAENRAGDAHDECVDHDDALPTTPPAREIDAETNPTRKAGLAAVARMLAGTPSIARPGLLSKAGLVCEAQVDRNHITQGTCRDLANLAQHRSTPATARQADQQATIDRLTAQPS